MNKFKMHDLICNISMLFMIVDMIIGITAMFIAKNPEAMWIGIILMTIHVLGYGFVEHEFTKDINE